MKLLIISSIKECQSQVADIFRETGIQVFSASEISGYKEGSPASLTHGWFGSGGDSVDSVMLFSFTENGKAQQALELIKIFNKTQETNFPLRGFILPIDQFGY